MHARRTLTDGEQRDQRQNKCSLHACLAFAALVVALKESGALFCEMQQAR